MRLGDALWIVVGGLLLLTYAAAITIVRLWLNGDWLRHDPAFWLGVPALAMVSGLIDGFVLGRVAQARALPLGTGRGLGGVAFGGRAGAGLRIARTRPLAAVAAAGLGFEGERRALFGHGNRSMHKDAHCNGYALRRLKRGLFRRPGMVARCVKPV